MCGNNFCCREDTVMAHFRMHGANPEKLYKNLGIPMPDKIYDFSTNTNALEWDGEIILDMKKTLCDYPDDEASDVRALLAKKNNRQEREILVTNGSNETIYLLASYQGGKNNAVLEPVYGEYRRALESYHAAVRTINSLNELTAEDRTIWLCNPCNPTGSYLSGAELSAVFLKNRANLGIVDEAYRDFLLGEDRSPDFKEFENVVVMRSLTKIYHLCGSRIGYVMASETIIAMLKLRQPTWSVNSLAQTAAAAFLNDEEFPAKTREYYRKEIPRFMGMLLKAGAELLPTSVNYFLMKVYNDEDFITFMLKHGFVVRHTRNFSGLGGGYVRIAARTPHENELFVQAVKDYLTP